DFDLLALPRVARSVPHDVLNRAVQQRGLPQHNAIIGDNTTYAAVAVLGLEVCVLTNFTHQLPEINSGSLHSLCAALQPGDREQPSDQLIQALSFQLDPF